MAPSKKIPLLVKKTYKKPTDPSKVVKVTLSPKESVATNETVVETTSEPISTNETVVETTSEPISTNETVVETTSEPISTNESVNLVTDNDVHDVDLDEPEPDIKDHDQYVTLSPEQKEDLIDKLETKKHKLKKLYKQAVSQNDDQAVRILKVQLKEVGRLLATVKECDAVDKAMKNKDDADKLSKDFKNKYKKLAICDFNKIIDLTAPKEDRKPDISTEQIWHRSKDVIFKNKTYRKAPSDKTDKFKNKMALKSMPKHLMKDLQQRTTNNTNVINIHNNHRNKLDYRQYDPLTFNGLNIY
jgi:hypothetical protein